MKQEKINMSESSWQRIQHRKWLKFKSRLTENRTEEPKMTKWQEIEHKKWAQQTHQN